MDLIWKYAPFKIIQELFWTIKLIFDVHVQNKASKYNKIVGIVKRLSIIFLRNALLTLYKMFIRPHIDYADMFYGKPNNEFICKKIKAFNIKDALSLKEQFKECLIRNFIKKLGYSTRS